MLGNDWLLEYKAILNYRNKSLHVWKHEKRYNLTPRVPAAKQKTFETEGLPILNAAQARHCVRKGDKAFLVQYQRYLVDSLGKEYFSTVSLESSHSPFLSVPEEVTKIIEEVWRKSEKSVWVYL